MYDLPISISDALPLSYRRLVVAIKLGSCDKHPHTARIEKIVSHDNRNSHGLNPFIPMSDQYPISPYNCQYTVKQKGDKNKYLHQLGDTCSLM